MLTLQKKLVCGCDLRLGYVLCMDIEKVRSCCIMYPLATDMYNVYVPYKKTKWHLSHSTPFHKCHEF